MLSQFFSNKLVIFITPQQKYFNILIRLSINVKFRNKVFLAHDLVRFEVSEF